MLTEDALSEKSGVAAPGPLVRKNATMIVIAMRQKSATFARMRLVKGVLSFLSAPSSIYIRTSTSAG